MMNQIRTDLAIEQHEWLTEAAEEIAGVALHQEDRQGIKVSRVKIETREAQEKMGRPMGHYITLEFPDLNLADGEELEMLCRTLAKELQSLLPAAENSRFLVVGLGNESITPDALGPSVIAKLMVTRHLFTYLPEETYEGLSSVSAIAPGVLGTTGIETGEIIQSVVSATSPDAVIAVDALAARSMDRIRTTIQLCDTGIAPGAGVGNRRKALDKASLGVPVIAIGVPTVIDAATIATDVLEMASTREDAIVSGQFQSLDQTARYAKLRAAIPPALEGFIVTPKDVDLMLARVARAVAGGINFALHEEITMADMEAYTS